MNGPCAKTVVACIIFDADGRQFLGTNYCKNPQKVCPREPGEDYTKCKTICDQQGHAEEVALRLAQRKGARLEGDETRAEVYGHTYACQFCQEALYKAGVRWIGVESYRVPSGTLSEGEIVE